MDDKCYLEDAVKRSTRGNRGCFAPFMVLVVVFISIVCSCATKKKIEYVDREVTKYKIQVQHDTLINNTHDSIYHTIYQKGDTVFDTKYIERLKYKYINNNQRDTLWRDSIITEIKEVVTEKRLCLNGVFSLWLGARVSCF